MEFEMCASDIPCSSPFAHLQYVFVHSCKDTHSQVVRDSVEIALMSRLSWTVIDIHPRLTKKDVDEFSARERSTEMLAEGVGQGLPWMQTSMDIRVRMDATPTPRTSIWTRAGPTGG